MMTMKQPNYRKGGLFDRPAAIGSGTPLEHKVKVQHRSDILMEEQIQTVKNMQDALRRSLTQFEQARSEDEFNFHSRQVIDLKAKNDEMMLILKVVHKINAELGFARIELQKALKTNGDVNLARKRVGWLEDRMENLLGRKRKRSPVRAQIQSAMMLDDPRLMMYSHDSQGSDMPLGIHGGEDFITETSMEETPQQLPLRPDDNLKTENEEEASASSREPSHSASDSRASDSPASDSTASDIESHEGSNQDALSQEMSTPESTPDESLEVDAEDQDSRQVTVMTVKHEQSDVTESSSATSAISRSSTTSTSSGEEEPTPPAPSVTTHGSKGSRVTIKSPTAELENVLDNEVERSSSGVDYWDSEHHRFEHSEYASMLCQLNPLSYHQMGLAVPGSFVDEVDGEPFLPWRPKRKGSDVTDIHKLELDRLEKRVHRMYEKVHDAAMLSVRPVPPDMYGISLMNQFDLDLTLKDKSKNKASKNRTRHIINKPTMAKFVSMDRLGKQESRAFPPLDKDRLGSSMSGRLIYYPNPLPYPKKLPITRTNREKEYPRQSDAFVEGVPASEGPPDRFVNQRNLLKETKFTSSLYRSRPSRRSPTSSERRFNRMLLGATPSSNASGHGELDSRSRANKPSHTRSRSRSGKKRAQCLRATFQTAKGLVIMKDKEDQQPFAKQQSLAFSQPTVPGYISGNRRGGIENNKWKQMKPKSGALHHSGLKWERVKSIVHDSLTSQNEEERVDAARLLGALKCGDAMVTFALKERLSNDDLDRVQYEACKALILLGCWDQEVVARVVKFMMNGNSAIISDMLKTLINGKNVQYVNKKMSSFPDLSMVLSELCQFDDVNDKISLDAAVALGKLCVADENAKRKLRHVLGESNTHVKAQALEILVRQLNYHGWDMIEAVLDQLKKSPVWKYRKNAAKLLIVLGKKHVCIDGKIESVFELLDRQLWDDPNKQVRQEVARTMAALEMFAPACERAEKRLEDPLEDVRAQAVISLGTLGMKNERILRVLLEMLELDSSEYVRLMIIRTMANMNSQDKRVLRVLRDKERGEGPLAREAKKALDIL